MFSKISSCDFPGFILLEREGALSEVIGDIIGINIDAEINGAAIRFDISQGFDNGAFT